MAQQTVVHASICNHFIVVIQGAYNSEVHCTTNSILQLFTHRFVTIIVVIRVLTTLENSGIFLILENSGKFEIYSGNF